MTYIAEFMDADSSCIGETKYHVSSLAEAMILAHADLPQFENCEWVSVKREDVE